MNNLLSQVDIGTQFGSPIGQTTTLNQYASLLIKTSISVAGLVLVFLLMFGGYQIMVSAGSGNAEGTAKGKKAITSAIVGFLIIFFSYWVIRLIEVITGNNFLTQPVLP